MVVVVIVANLLLLHLNRLCPVLVAQAVSHGFSALDLFELPVHFWMQFWIMGQLMSNSSSEAPALPTVHIVGFLSDIGPPVTVGFLAEDITCGSCVTAH